MLKKNTTTILIIIGIAIFLAGISAVAFPDWLKIPGGWLILLGTAIVGVAKIGGDLKNWRDFLFGKEDDEKNAQESIIKPVQVSQRLRPKEKPHLTNQKTTKHDNMNNLDDIPDVSISSLRLTLNKIFDDVQLDAFCMDHFPDVFNRFSRGMRKDEKISLLLDYCYRLPDRIEKLVRATGQYQK